MSAVSTSINSQKNLESIANLLNADAVEACSLLKKELGKYDWFATIHARIELRAATQAASNDPAANFAHDHIFQKIDEFSSYDVNVKRMPDEEETSKLIKATKDAFNAVLAAKNPSEDSYYEVFSRALREISIV